MSSDHSESVSTETMQQRGRKLILSVDDELSVLYSRYKLLSSAGYAVLSATDGVQALQIFGSNAIDLVLLDFLLEGMDGGSVADGMRAYKPEVPILMVSGVTVPSECLAKVNGFVCKSDGAEALLKSISGLMCPKPIRPGIVKSYRSL